MTQIRKKKKKEEGENTRRIEFMIRRTLI